MGADCFRLLLIFFLSSPLVLVRPAGHSANRLLSLPERTPKHYPTFAAVPPVTVLSQHYHVDYFLIMRFKSFKAPRATPSDRPIRRWSNGPVAAAAPLLVQQLLKAPKSSSDEPGGVRWRVGAWRRVLRASGSGVRVSPTAGRCLWLPALWVAVLGRSLAPLPSPPLFMLTSERYGRLFLR